MSPTMKRNKEKLEIVLVVVFICMLGESVGETCPPLQPTAGIHLSCKSPGGISDCSAPVEPLTIADYKCHEFYRPLLRSSVNSGGQLQCSENGVWINLYKFQEYLCEIDCGKPVREHTHLIAFGQNTIRYSWPWHASIFVRDPKTSLFEYICGGSLMNARVVLTAAHCLITRQNYPLDSYIVVLGGISSSWTQNKKDQHAQFFRVKRIFVAEEYEDRYVRADIGLFELDRSVVLTETVSPICFPYENDLSKPDQPMEIGEVIGFGLNENKEKQLHLQYTKLPILRNGECSKVLSRVPGVEQFCAGVINGSTVCLGDSGGGMVFRSPTGARYYVQRWVAHIVNTVGSSQYLDEQIFAEGRHADLARAPRNATSSEIFHRRLILMISDEDKMGYGVLDNGGPTDKIWLDRSLGGGSTWDGRLGFSVVPQGSTSTITPMFNIHNPSNGKIGVMRVCGITGDRVNIACSSWAQKRHTLIQNKVQNDRTMNKRNAYVDGRSADLAKTPRNAVSKEIFERRIILMISDEEGMGYGVVENGDPTDEVWVDRSSDAGFSWDGHLGLTSVPQGSRMTKTTMFNIDNLGKGRLAALRACGKAGNRPDIVCTNWVQR